MPLIAMKLSSGQRIDIRDYESVRIEMDCSDLVCPLDDCRIKMFPVHGNIVSPHFRHATDCTTAYRASWGTGLESAEHRMGKRVIAERELAWLNEHRINATADFEIPIPEVKRIADVIVTITDTGERIVYECQLAAISIQELAARTNDYARAGLSCHWYIGLKADTPDNSAWCLHKDGCVNILQFASSSENRRSG